MAVVAATEVVATEVAEAATAEVKKPLLFFERSLLCFYANQILKYLIWFKII